jgi:hypothetical protein
VEISGTTFSGLSTKTTWGNTLRSLFYVWFYLATLVLKKGKPWDNDLFFAIASGDDVVVFCEPSLAEKIEELILSHTTRSLEKTIDGLPNHIGLG